MYRRYHSVDVHLETNRCGKNESTHWRSTEIGAEHGPSHHKFGKVFCGCSSDRCAPIWEWYGYTRFFIVTNSTHAHTKHTEKRRAHQALSRSRHLCIWRNERRKKRSNQLQNNFVFSFFFFVSLVGCCQLVCMSGAARCLCLPFLEVNEQTS